MSLFHFELRKLFLNRKTLIILAFMFFIYAIIGFGTTYFLVGNGQNYQTFAELAEPLTGPLNVQKAAEARIVYEGLKARYGGSEEAIYYGTSTDPRAKFDVDYAHFADHVDEYYNGSPMDSLGDPYGINVLQGNLNVMEQAGKVNTFEYRKTIRQLRTEKLLGEPQFANTVLWANLFTNWGDFIMLFLLFVPLAFIIAPVFSIEASTGMDNLILSSRHGRYKIVSAKIAAVMVTSLVIVSLYIIATFVFGFLSVGTLDGVNAVIRSIPAYVRSPFGFTNWQFALVAALWLFVSGVVYALIVAFISSRTGNLLAAFGISLIVLFLNVGLSALGTTLSQILKVVIDFGIASIALIGEVFTAYKMYNLFGIVVPYYFMIILFMTIVSILAIFGMYWGQRRRTVG
ncbi:MAG: ABC transporter permease subunit [Treponema sp.]|jgi:ABC-type transport system involved in multi-copper enzyme maturation permease subunit|nr:ABC transporter permease subunit [Treponema sp.]